MLGRLPHRDEGYTLDLDSTVFQRYGKHDGAAKGYNPQQPGRSSHHPILAVLAEAHFVLNGWLRSGNSGTARGVVEFLKEAVGRKLFEISDYTFRVFVTNMADAPEDIWRDYNKRANMEKRILELKYDLACDDFCMRQFTPPMPRSERSLGSSISLASSKELRA